MKKIKVSVCCGTTCFLMGSSDVLALEDQLDSDLKDLVDFEGSPCMDLCKSKQSGKAPFVKINDELIASANPDLVKIKILEHKERMGL
jgi:NADH:ubiquinone oxidoreductase subunit E